jgi:hypothetical protein
VQDLLCARLPGTLQHICYLAFSLSDSTAQDTSHAVLYAAAVTVAGEDTRSVASLLAVIVPAILVPCAVVGLIVALGSIARTRRANWHKPGTAADGYTLLDAGPCSGAAGQPLAEGAGGSVSSSRGAMGLGILKAMSRRARAKRMRRSCRPAYVGLPEQSAQQHRWVQGCADAHGPCCRDGSHVTAVRAGCSPAMQLHCAETGHARASSVSDMDGCASWTGRSSVQSALLLTHMTLRHAAVLQGLCVRVPAARPLLPGGPLLQVPASGHAATSGGHP